MLLTNMRRGSFQRERLIDAARSQNRGAKGSARFFGGVSFTGVAFAGMRHGYVGARTVAA